MRARLLATMLRNHLVLVFGFELHNLIYTLTHQAVQKSYVMFEN